MLLLCVDVEYHSNHVLAGVLNLLRGFFFLVSFISFLVSSFLVTPVGWHTAKCSTTRSIVLCLYSHNKSCFANHAVPGQTTLFPNPYPQHQMLIIASGWSCTSAWPLLVFCCSWNWNEIKVPFGMSATMVPSTLDPCSVSNSKSVRTPTFTSIVCLLSRSPLRVWLV